jgi:hypothetical protein
MRDEERSLIYAEWDWFKEDHEANGILEALAQHEVQALKKDVTRWVGFVESIRRHYRRVGWTAEFLTFAFASEPESIPLNIAEMVLNDADKFPLSLVSQAEARSLREAQAEVESVAALAQRDGWFAS